MRSCAGTVKTRFARVWRVKKKKKSDFLSFQKIDFFDEVRFDCACAIKTHFIKKNQKTAFCSFNIFVYKTYYGEIRFDCACAVKTHFSKKDLINKRDFLSF